MMPLQWSQLITLLLTIAVFVILIVVLTRNSLPDSVDAEAKITKLDNKVNWLYGLAIAETGLLMLSLLIGFIFMTRWFSK
jgi:hypothetical protein